MPTIRQKKALSKIMENHGNVSQAMRDVGYTEATAKNPSNLLDSQGFMQLMDQKGLTDDFIVQALVDDIESKPGKRIQELQLAVKMRGRMNETDTPLTNLTVNILGKLTPEELAYAQQIVTGRNNSLPQD